MPQFFLSIIVPVYKVEKYIETCVNSLFDGDMPDIEYIFVDDCSPDNSMEIIKRQIRLYKIPANRVNLLKNPVNQGLSMTRNHGVSVAQGNYIWFVDSDDWVASEHIASMVALLKKKKPQLLTFGVERTDADQYHIFYNSGIKNFTGIFPGKNLLFRISPCAQFYIIEQKFWHSNAFAFFPGIYHEDTELTPKMRYLSKEAMVYPEIVYYYRITESSIVAVPRLKRALDLLIVCSNLHEFMKTVVNKEDYSLFAEIIAVAYISSLRVVACLPTEDRKKFKAASKSYSDILSVFRFCPELRHRAAGKLLKYSWFENILISFFNVKRMIRLK